jgi:hypothetical protein
MIPDPYFEEYLARWQVVPAKSTGVGILAVVDDSVAGKSVFQNNPGALPWLSSTTMLPVNRHHTYEARGSFRRESLSGTTGTIYLAVRLFNDAKAEIAGAGDWWLYPAENVSIADDQWHTYSGRFGSGTAHPIPADGRYMTVGAILNNNGGAPGDRVYQVAGLGIWPVARSTMYTRDTAVGCPPARTTTPGTTVLVSQAFVLDRAADVHTNVQILSRALGRRDTVLFVDGVRANYHLLSTPVNDWAVHAHAWAGSLGEGAHTIELRANTTLASPDGYGCGGDWGYIATSFAE